MKIFIYGDSNTCGQIPNLEAYKKDADIKFYSKNELWWFGLTKEHEVFVNGLPGRAIARENPWLEGRTAMLTIQSDISCINPDLIIIQLGTNDCKNMYELSAEDITKNLELLIRQISMLKEKSPRFLIVSPAKILEGNKITDKYYIGAEQKSAKLDKLYRKICQKNGFDFISGLDLEVGEDGEHLTKLGHRELSKRVNLAVKRIENEMETKQEKEL